MLLERKIILGTENDHRIVLEKYACELSVNKLYESRSELQKHIESNGNGSLTWGYFPEIKDQNQYPKCRILEEELSELLLSKINKNFSLAFIRLSVGKPASDYGGLHIDVDIGVGHTRTTPYEIVRLIANIGDAPRTIEYIDIDSDDLKNMEVEISRDKYAIITPPKSIKIKKLEIPPREKDAIWILRFWSSLIPHAGITNEDGHFVAAYGMYSSGEDCKI